MWLTGNGAKVRSIAGHKPDPVAKAVDIGIAADVHGGQPLRATPGRSEVRAFRRKHQPEAVT